MTVFNLYFVLMIFKSERTDKSSLQKYYADGFQVNWVVSVKPKIINSTQKMCVTKIRRSCRLYLKRRVNITSNL